MSEAVQCSSWAKNYVRACQIGAYLDEKKKENFFLGE